jgi:hypothetical protein
MTPILPQFAADLLHRKQVDHVGSLDHVDNDRCRVKEWPEGSAQRDRLFVEIISNFDQTEPRWCLAPY